ncbi:DUF262 domain-containing protein [Bacillus sp. FSL W7-1034]|uniref:DUF262 domain-containing protein n=1 Tax=Bacillus sp. FSL W7-1034 TaxID=2954564 RepID=UPI00315ADC1B
MVDDLFNFENNSVEYENEQIEYVEEIKVVTRGVDFSVRELKMLREEKELVVPQFQRELVWDNKRKSRFIESILLGYPIPGMFFTDLEAGQMMIIDGQQRINTLVEFLNNELKIIKRDDINPKWRGRFYREIDEESQRRLRNTNIRASVFQILSDEVDKNIALYSLFERINTGSIQLNSQEIRRAIYFGEFIKELNSFVEKPIWLAAYKAVFVNETEELKKDKRLNDQEIIARYFTIQSLIDNNELDSDISYKKEINRYMSGMQKTDLTLVIEKFQELENKLDWLQSQIKVPVGYLFRRPTEEILDLEGLQNHLKGKKFNIPLFESIMICLDKINFISTKFDLEKHFSLFNDPKFVESISAQTNRLENINYRISAIKEVFFSGE